MKEVRTIAHVVAGVAAFTFAIALLMPVPAEREEISLSVEYMVNS
jgi:hypothetical protein